MIQNNRAGTVRVVSYAFTLVLLSSIAFGQGSEISNTSRIANVSSTSTKHLEVLRQSIMTLLAPDSWEDVGGNGSIMALKDWNLLVVNQREEVHEQIHAYLAKIGQIVAMRSGNESGAQVRVIHIGELRRIHLDQHIEKVLSQPTQLIFDDVPLSDVAKTLAKSHGINVTISRGALKAAGIAPDIPVRTRQIHVPFRLGLNDALRELDLACVVRAGVLVITTNEDAQTWPSTKVYDVSRLLTE